MKPIVSTLMGVMIGAVIGAFAQSLTTTVIPAYTRADKIINLNLPASTRIICVTNPTANPGGSVLLDHTVPVGLTFLGELSVRGTIQ